jgi:hypothetical protein
MDVTISITEQAAQRLQQRASASGEAVPAYAAKIVEQAVAGPTLEELLAPVQADFVAGGMSDDQLLDLGRDLLDKVRAEKKD